MSPRQQQHDVMVQYKSVLHTPVMHNHSSPVDVHTLLASHLARKLYSAQCSTKLNTMV
jgi:hypothetical protein